jgi:hypothetical protein
MEKDMEERLLKVWRGGEISDLRVIVEEVIKKRMKEQQRKRRVVEEQKKVLTSPQSQITLTLLGFIQELEENTQKDWELLFKMLLILREPYEELM